MTDKLKMLVRLTNSRSSCHCHGILPHTETSSLRLLTCSSRREGLLRVNIEGEALIEENSDFQEKLRK